MKQASFVLLTLLVVASSLLQPKNPPARSASSLLPKYVTKGGNITLFEYEYGFTASVDFASHYSDASVSDSENEDNAMYQMSISLYSSESFVVSDCFEFYQYSCSSYNCYEYTWWTTNLTYPSFSLQGYYSSVTMYLDYANWELNTYAVMATSCTSDMNYPSFGKSRSGMIGLGVNDTTANFLKPPFFTVSTNTSYPSANLYFGEDTQRKAISDLKATWTSNADWHVDGTNSSITIGATKISFNATVIFDWDSDGIGFPHHIFTNIVQLIRDYNTSFEFSCNSSYVTPKCDYQGYLGGLPMILLTVQGSQIEIPPTLYVRNLHPDENEAYMNEIVLNLKGMSPSLTGAAYVTPQFKDYVILDRNFLNYYFAEFSSSNNYNQINVYTPYTYTAYNPTNPYHRKIVWPFIVGGCVGLLVILVIIVCCYRVIKNKRLANASRISQSDPFNSSMRTLAVNDERTTVLHPQQSVIPSGQNIQQTGYPYYQQQRTQPHNYGNLPGYTYIPSHNAYPQPSQGYVNANPTGYYYPPDLYSRPQGTQ